MNRFVKSINRVSLIQQIIIGLIIGILTALYVPDVANELALLGVLFSVPIGWYTMPYIVLEYSS